jgi:hypothetical protein
LIVYSKTKGDRDGIAAARVPARSPTIARGGSVLAFGSSAEVSARFDHFLTEACRSESRSRPRVSQLEDDVQQTEVGRFRLTRRGRLVFLDVVVDGQQYQKLLKTSDRNAWDWGEEIRI